MSPPSPFEFSVVDATSEEEGVVVDVPLPLLNSGGSSAASADDRGDSPFDEARADGDDAAAEPLANHAGNTDAEPPVMVNTTEEKPPGGEHNYVLLNRLSGSVTEKESGSKSNASSDLAKIDEGSEHHDANATQAYYTTRPSNMAHFPWHLSVSQWLREFRHSNCLMTPISFLVLLAVAVSSIVGLLFAFPQFVLGILLGPLVRRNFWLVEFLYRFNVAGWGHIKIMELAGRSRRQEQQGGGGGKKKKNAKEKKGIKNEKKDSPTSKTRLGGHSETIHQRITVVPGRVYIHPIPLFTDDIAYLIVCTPPPTANTLPLTGVLVDCGEASKIMEYTEAIYDRHYAREYPRNGHRAKGRTGGIELYAILCTHRHHDHTAGLGPLKKLLAEARKDAPTSGKVLVGADVYKNVQDNVLIVGGAVEDVPHCNLFVKNGCFVPLPRISASNGEDDLKASQVNDMNAVVSIEVIGVPCHTRGSVVYALRNRAAPQFSDEAAHRAEPLQSHLFTGDAVFSGGSGVPFEADMEYASDNFVKNRDSLKSKNGSSPFRPGAGSLSMERCFTEVLVRAAGRWSSSAGAAPPQDAASSPGTTLLYPGHEYTTDLLLRQFDPRNIPPEGSWTRMPPSTFFETASHYLVSAHRRALPPGQKLLTIPTPLEREKVVNPNFRSLKRRGEHVANALRLWYEYGAKELLTDRDADAGGSGDVPTGNAGPASVFTTVFSADLDEVVRDLREGTVTPRTAADRIVSLKRKLDRPLIGRRPIPGTLPGHKNVYLGVLALAMLGSPPSAVTASDAEVMGMAPPADSADRILISRRRLIAALEGLGLLASDNSPRLGDIARLLWKEARLEGDPPKRDLEQDKDRDVEASISDDPHDAIELGLLKLALFGVALGQRAKVCMPCGGGGRRPRYDEKSWVTTSRLRRTNGELVRHDPATSPLCKDVSSSCPYGECTPAPSR